MSREIPVRFREGVGVKFPRATRLVILCRGTAHKALATARVMLEGIGLALNEQKTRVCNAWNEPFDFLGYTFGVQYYFGSGKPYLGVVPSPKSVGRLKEKIRKVANNSTGWLYEEVLVKKMNALLRGWRGYFRYGTLWKTYSLVDLFAWHRVQGWLVHKHKVGGRGNRRFPCQFIYRKMGIYNLCEQLRHP